MVMADTHIRLLESMQMECPGAVRGYATVFGVLAGVQATQATVRA